MINITHRRASVKYSTAFSPGIFRKYSSDILRYLKTFYKDSPKSRNSIISLVRLFAYYGAVFPSAVTVAGENNMSARQFWRALGVMVNGGLIKIQPRFLNRHQRSNVYDLRELIKEILEFIRLHHEFPPGKLAHFLGALVKGEVSLQYPLLDWEPDEEQVFRWQRGDEWAACARATALEIAYA